MIYGCGEKSDSSPPKLEKVDNKQENAKGNRLAQEKSPYLLQHANNPVDWYPWGEEAFAKAKALDRPVFLSIGYSTCHWCHVMEHESFEDEEVAKVMNENFQDNQSCVKEKEEILINQWFPNGKMPITDLWNLFGSRKDKDFAGN